MSFALTKTYLNSLDDGILLSLKLDGLKGQTSYPEISEIENYTKKKVGDLLDNETIDYILTSDGDLIDLDKNLIAVEYNHDCIMSEDSISVGNPLLSKYVNEGNDIIYNGDKYENASVVTKKFVSAINKSDIIHSDKRKDGVKYFKFKKANVDYYFDVSSIIPNFCHENGTKNTISLMEITSLNLTDEEMNTYIQKFFGFIDGDDETEFLENINGFFSTSKQIFESRVKLLSGTPFYQKIRNTRFDSIQDVRDFLKECSREDKNGRNKKVREITTCCTILKYIYILNKYSTDPLYIFLNELEDNEKKQKNLIRILFSLGSGEDIQGPDNRGVYKFDKRDVGGRFIPVTFRFKSIESILEKALAKAEYINLNSLADLFGSSFHLEGPDDSFKAEILSDIDVHLYAGAGIGKNKNLLSKKDLEGKEKLPGHDKFINDATSTERNIGTDKNYKDYKLTGPITFVFEGKEYTIKGETKILYGRPDLDLNETGMTSHPVYDYFSKFFIGEANRNPFIYAKDLKKMIDGLYHYLGSDLFKAKYPQKTKKLVLQEIHEQLKGDFSISNNNYFPQSDISGGKIENFYVNNISEMIFLYLAETHKLKRATIEKGSGDLCFTTEYNRKQLTSGYSGYTFKN